MSNSDKWSVRTFTLRWVDAINKFFCCWLPILLTQANRYHNQRQKQSTTSAAETDHEPLTIGRSRWWREDIGTSGTGSWAKDSCGECVLSHKHLCGLCHRGSVVIVSKDAEVVRKELASENCLVISSHWRIQTCHKKTTTVWPSGVSVRSCECW
jgi:hypothetical protein